jgi:hypothetical protein
MNEHSELPPYDVMPASPLEMPPAAADEPHPAEAHAIEFDASSDGATSDVRATTLPFAFRTTDDASDDAHAADQPWSSAVAQARLRLLELQSEQVEPLRAAVLSHGRATGAPGAATSPSATTSPRLARRVQDLLDEAEIAADESEWGQAAEWLLDALVLEPENDEALALLAMATRRLAVGAISAAPTTSMPHAGAPESPPSSRPAPLPEMPELPAAMAGAAAPTDTPRDAVLEASDATSTAAGASLDIAVARWEARGFRVRERSATDATLRERRHVSIRGFLASLLLGGGLGGVVYLVYALLLQRRREIRLAIHDDRVVLAGDLRQRNPVVVALDVVAAVAALAALSLLAIGGAQIGGLI